jgi:hypothetical protein
MAAPLRITTPAGGKKAPGAGARDDFNSYLDRLVKMVPAEVVSLYLVGVGFIPKTDALVLAGWAALCLIGLLALRTYGTAERRTGKSPQWGAIAISSIAFIVWVYTLGGPFETFGVHIPYVGSLLVLAMTFFAPIFYKGEPI